MTRRAPLRRLPSLNVDGAGGRRNNELTNKFS
jgi:hypothetical protein